MKRGFTLIELSVATGVGMMLIGVIYFIYFGLVRTSARAEDKETLNKVANVQLERMVRELRQADAILSVKPDELRFRKFRTGSAAEEESHEYTGEKPEFDTVTFSVKAGENDVSVLRAENLDKPSLMFTVQKCDPEVFTAYVQAEADPEKEELPRIHRFDPVQQISRELPRIVLIRIHLDMAQLNDALDLRTAVALPAVLARLRQPNWNSE
ncbi:MAG: prepilin-type N-terminal cleavage/methylation domain-containing protein [Candidatus Riflebacteria bacterium]|nr:prepilin-type N-terminal cleavage/methylation domain-containing protein [Candidatus Riflebacteria bacterium]